MTRYADASPYVYFAMGETNTVNVGWLAAVHPFPETEPSSEFLEALLSLCAKPMNKTRDWHQCDLCDHPVPLVVEAPGLRLPLGSAEIRVQAADGSRFAAPDLIYHYVRDHRYKPPDSFVVAALAIT